MNVTSTTAISVESAEVEKNFIKMSNNGWTDKTSKKGRKKRDPAWKAKLNAENEKKKKSKRNRKNRNKQNNRDQNNDNNNNYNNNENVNDYNNNNNNNWNGGGNNDYYDENYNDGNYNDNGGGYYDNNNNNNWNGNNNDNNYYGNNNRNNNYGGYNNNNNNNYNNNGGQRGRQQQERGPRLNRQQYQMSRQISNLWPDIKYDHVLSNVVTKLELDYFNKDDEQNQIDVLTQIMSELQDSVSGKTSKSKKNNNNKKKNDNNNNSNNKNKSSSSKKNNKNNKKSKQKNSGKFKRWMTNFGDKDSIIYPSKRCVGAVFLDFLDDKTLINLTSIEEFSFIITHKKILNNIQRLNIYTSPNEILLRIKQFNTSLNCASSLKFYKLNALRNKNENNKQFTKTQHFLKIIIGNALNLNDSFRAKYDKNPVINIDLNLNKKQLENNDILEKILKDSGVKTINIWNACDIYLSEDKSDLNDAYLTEFAEYQQSLNVIKVKEIKNNMNAFGEGSVGKYYLENLNKFILNEKLIKKENIKSLNCGYVKIKNNYQLSTYLFLFIELKPKNLGRNKKDIKQFMVWFGQSSANKVINRY